MSDQLADVVTYARSKLGDPYVWGATGPNSFDCSGLIFAAYKAAGVAVSRTTAATLGTMGKSVSLSDAKPGMVVYFDEKGATDHVGIYLGNGQMIDAPTEGKPVKVDPINGYTSIRDLGADGGGGGLGGIVGAITNPVGTATSAVTDAVSSVFGGWQDDLLSVGIKVLAGTAAATLVVIGAWQSVRDSA